MSRTTVGSIARVVMAAFVAAGAGSWPIASSAATTAVCPARVHLESGRVAAGDVPASYKATVDPMPLPLSGVSIYDGPPEQGAALVPTSAGRNGDRSTWAFAGTYPDGKWLSCDYANGLVHLSIRADDASVSCDAVATKSGDPKILRGTFTCR